jgi:hypothetical protein
MTAIKKGRPKGQPPKAETLEREAEVVKLRRGGLTWDVIAQRVGYAGARSAQIAFERANLRLVEDDLVVIRRLETERLDLAQSAIWGKVLQGDNASITNLLRIMERRAKLLGLDQPTRIQAEVITYDANSIEARLASIIANRSDSSAPLRVAGTTGEADTVTAAE